jgi:hypothetical protein
MTCRELIDRRFRPLQVAVLLGLALFAGGILAGSSRGRPPELILALPGFALTFLAAMALHLGAIRCPACRGNLGVVGMTQRRPGLGLARAIRYCPYCGQPLDEPPPGGENPGTVDPGRDDASWTWTDARDPGTRR